ncbi:MAG: DNA polymerase III subunit delta' [Micavibrio sp.]|nr:DNA polymerase III subunit delta' [Micavibrio sp.]
MVSLFADEDDDIPLDIEADVDDAAPPEALDVSPRTNPELLGHEAAEKAILADFNAGRMPHALILAGPSGIGKATFAYRIARFLFTNGGDQDAGLFGEPEKPSTLATPAAHPVFSRVASGGHSDFAVIEREYDDKKDRLKNDISIEAVRKIHPFLQKTAAEGGWRVVIVDSAEYLNHSSQNALLKILEEPPKKTVLILTTSQPGTFLPTIRSRCRMIYLDPLPENIVGTLLEKYAPAISPADKMAVSRYAEGSIGCALRFYQEKGIDLYRTILALIGNLPQLDVVKVHDLADKIGRVEQSYETAREIMTGWCERIARLQARGLAIPDILPGDGAIFTRLTEQYPPRHFLTTWEKMSQLFLQAEYSNLDKRQALIGAFLMLQNPDHAAISV